MINNVNMPMWKKALKWITGAERAVCLVEWFLGEKERTV
jgi:hypothetical protein